jgi:hypothetical protein
MQRLFRILVFALCGLAVGACTWIAIIKIILYFLGQQHGEGLAHIPAPFLGWLSLIIGALNGGVIGMVLGSFRALKVWKAALLAPAITFCILLTYYLVMDPGISLLVTAPSFTSLKNFTGSAVVLSAPSPVIGVIIALVCASIFGGQKFELFAEDLRGNTKELIEPDARAHDNTAD